MIAKFSKIYLLSVLFFSTTQVFAQNSVTPLETDTGSVMSENATPPVSSTAVVSTSISASTSAVASVPAPIMELPQQTSPALKATQHDMSPMGMYQAADWVVKSVMISLLFASVLTWAVLIAKQAQLTIACRRSQSVLGELVESESFSEAEQRCDELKGGGLALISSTRHELILSSMGEASDDGIKERVHIRLQRVEASLNTKMTVGTGVLATIGSVGPFVGLFGTVWGIMNAFIGIAESQSTTLVVVAPGIAEALLATAIGLVAAIPAVVIYNHFTRAIGRYRASLADITAALLVLVSRDLDRKPTSLKAASQQMKNVG